MKSVQVKLLMATFLALFGTAIAAAETAEAGDSGGAAAAMWSASGMATQLIPDGPATALPGSRITLRARLTDAYSQPLPNLEVQFYVLSMGYSIVSVNLSATTDQLGWATVDYVCGGDGLTKIIWCAIFQGATIGETTYGTPIPQEQTITIEQPPKQQPPLPGPTLVSPGNRAKAVSRTPDLRWKSVKGAKGYHVVVMSVKRGVEKQVLSQNVSKQSAYHLKVTRPLDRNTTYRWWVETLPGGVPSKAATFTTATR